MQQSSYQVNSSNQNARHPSTAIQAIEKIKDHRPDLVLQDTPMRDPNGYEVVRLINLDPKPLVVFITALDQYAIKAFEVNAIDYALKPIDEARLKQTMERVVQNNNSPHVNFEKLRILLQSTEKPKSLLPHIPLRRGKRIFLKDPSDIFFLRSEKKVTIVATVSGEYWSSYTLAEIEETLDEKLFFRTHRSTIINLNRIKEIVPAHSGVYDVYLTGLDRVCLPLSRDRARILRQRYNF